MNNEREAPTYLFATIDATTGRGGHVSDALTNTTIQDEGLAVVGGIMTYEDGTQAMIVDGAGFAATWTDKPVAVIGSHLSNGARNTIAARHDLGISVPKGAENPGLFEPEWTPSHNLGQEGDARA